VFNSIFSPCAFLLLEIVFLWGSLKHWYFYVHLSKQKGDYKTALRKYRKALRYLDVCWEKEELDESKLPRCFRDGIS